MGLGRFEDVSLAEARDKAAAARKLVREGIDPIAARAAARTAAKPKVTFGDAVEHYLAAHAPGWRSPRHRKGWRASLANHVLPGIGSLPVAAIDTDRMLQVLEPLWGHMPDTAARLRGRIEAVLSYATARGWRVGPNPAVWRGHLQALLPARGKLHRVRHFTALDWREAPGLLARLHAGETDSIGARALQFVILTAARSGEVRGATWDEVDLQSAIWTIRANRMKTGREHRIPLSVPALAILESMQPLRGAGGLVFPGQSLTRPLAYMSLTNPLRRAGYPDLTAHGRRTLAANSG
jgi:integrase